MSRDGKTFETGLPAPYLVNHPEVSLASASAALFDSINREGSGRTIALTSESKRGGGCVRLRAGLSAVLFLKK